MICPDCGGAFEMTDDNGADYPETRVEFHECVNCGNTKRVVLSA